MTFLKKYGYYFLLFGVISDLLTPYILGIFYPKINQMTTVISVFGDVDSPVRQAFFIWSVLSGLLFVLAIPAVYYLFKDTSRSMAVILALAIGFYGVGDCIFTGVFSIDTKQATWTLSTWIHNIGSGLGYAGFILFPFFLMLLYKKQKETKYQQLYLLLSIISFSVAGFYGFARMPAFNHFPILNQLGFWQRVSFLFNYLPMMVFSVGQIKNERQKSAKVN
ncbi:hypothetical protein IGJ55_002915 [Enterococcus sp. AZ170]|uniref:DUF998 domain-containing protein n=1 Tax=Enterococcus sp. AZ170 TaxID=2774747 RepID=UPI003D2FD69A